MLRFLPFLCFISLFFSTYSHSEEQYFILSAGEKGTPYYEVSKEIRDILESTVPDTQVFISESSGSVENVERLKSGLADYIIVQQDIALNAYFNASEPYTNFEILLPLFPEALQVLVAGDHKRFNFTELSELIKSGKVQSMSIGPKDSATNTLIRTVFSIFGISTPSDFFREHSISKGLEDFKLGRVDSIAHVAAYPANTFKTISDPAVAILSMEKSEIAHIMSHVQGMSSLDLDSNQYPFDNANKKIQSIGTWALLAGQSSTDKKINAGIAEVILKRLSSGSIKKGSVLSQTYGDAKAFTFNAEDHHLVVNTGSGYQEFFRGLSLSSELLDLFADNQQSIIGYVILATVLIFFALAYRRFVHGIFDFLIAWNRYQHIAYSIVSVIAAYFILTFSIVHAEHQLAITSGLNNSFEEVNIFDVHIWLFVFSLTGYNGVLFPQTFSGQMLVTISAFLVPLGAVGAIVGEFVFNFRDRRRRQGVSDVKNENHIVICGWNDRVPTLIMKAMNAQDNYLLGKKSNIVVIAEEFGDVLNHDEDMQRLHKRREVEYIAGKARDPHVLAKANVDKAKTVILVAEDRTLDADERTLLSALSISRYCREKCSDHSVDNIYMIAEVNHEELRNTILNADVNEVVNVSDIGESLVVQSMFNHGVSTAISNMVAYNEFNEFYVIDASEVPSLSGMNFDQILPILRRHKILLTSIKSIVRGDDGKIIIDNKTIKQHLEKYDLVRQIITNPISPAENIYQLTADDQLILLSPSMKVVNEFIMTQHAKPSNTHDVRKQEVLGA
ncbi:MAG: NAD-binding protein [Oleispira sp.]|nr:NAD-binding protein [Oleispira sp.]